MAAKGKEELQQKCDKSERFVIIVASFFSMNFLCHFNCDHQNSFITTPKFRSVEFENLNFAELKPRYFEFENLNFGFAPQKWDFQAHKIKSEALATRIEVSKLKNSTLSFHKIEISKLKRTRLWVLKIEIFNLKQNWDFQTEKSETLVTQNWDFQTQKSKFALTITHIWFWRNRSHWTNNTVCVIFIWFCPRITS